MNLALLIAYFENGINISSYDVIIGLADEIGLSGSGLLDV